MTLQRISRILGTAGEHDAVVPPTMLYNEGWMLRIVLDWFSRQTAFHHDLAFASGAGWYTEGLLPSPFLPRSRGDRLAESHTHADGVVGHFKVGQTGEGDVSLADGAKQFLVLEAKMFSRLSRGVTHAREYNQAARNVACMAEILRLKGVRPEEMDSFGFHVLAPKSQLDGEPSFMEFLDKDHIRQTVAARVGQYGNAVKRLSDWYSEWFLPAIDKAVVKPLSWEGILDVIASADKEAGMEFRDFYEQCLRFNKKLDSPE